MSRPSACLISKSVSNGDDEKSAKVILADFKKVRVHGNEILTEILAKMPAKVIPEQQFIVLVDGSRYGIQILAVSKKQTVLFQHFLHYDGKKLTSVNHRRVVIQW